MNNLDEMPTKCHDCPYWELAEEPYSCVRCEMDRKKSMFKKNSDAVDRWAELKEDIQELYDNNQDKQDVATVLHFILNLMDVKEKAGNSLRREESRCTIWIVWWISSEGDSPEITVFTDPNKAQGCWKEHAFTAYECDIDEYSIYPEKPIDYSDCSNAMLKLRMVNIVTDGEYNRIMGRLNRAHVEGWL